MHLKGVLQLIVQQSLKFLLFKCFIYASSLLQKGIKEKYVRHSTNYYAECLNFH
jgi:hypothetical protein